MSTAGSVSRRIRKAQSGDADAVEYLCQRYYEQLASIARQKFGAYPRRVVDEYAVANEALQEFFERAQRGDFNQLNDRRGVLSVLVRLTKDKVVDEIRRISAAKRGAGRTRGDSIFAAANGAVDFNHFRGVYETPSTRQIVVEQIEAVLARLPDDACRQVLILRYDGYTNEEIAEQLQISVATVERKRRRIRTALADLDLP